MDKNEDLFLQVLHRLNECGILNQIVLIGSWVLPVYRTLFSDNPEIPLLRTTDIDFLIGMPPRIKVKADVPQLLAEIGFDAEWAAQGGYCKYVHPDLEVEFMVPDLGAGNRSAVQIKNLMIVAQPLRYLSLAYDHSLIVEYQGISVRVPEPAAFVLLKLLVIPRRRSPEKLKKDVFTVKSMGNFLIDSEGKAESLRLLFYGLPKGWQKTIRDTAAKHYPDLLKVVSVVR